MTRKLPSGVSQLDYLWTTFGDYQVSEGVQTPPDPNSLVSEEVLTNYVKDITEGAIVKLGIIENDDALELVGYSSSGSIITIVELEKEDYLTGVQLIMSTQVEIDNNICTSLDEPLLKFTMKQGKTYYVNLNQFKYTGEETQSIKTTVTSNKIAAHLKIDNSIETPVVDVKVTDNGLKIDLTLKESGDNQLRLVRTTEGLDTKYTWDDGNNILFQCLTYNQYHNLSNPVQGKVYFITDEMCIYLNGVRYGDNLSLMDTDTIVVKNNDNSVSLEVKIDPDQFNLISKSSAGVSAKLYWEE